MQQNNHEIDMPTHEVVADALLLADLDIPLEVVQAWTPKQRQIAFQWATATHLYASDNDDVIVPPKPDFISPFERQDSYLNGFTLTDSKPVITLDNCTPDDAVIARMKAAGFTYEHQPMSMNHYFVGTIDAARTLLNAADNAKLQIQE